MVRKFWSGLSQGFADCCQLRWFRWLIGSAWLYYISFDLFRMFAQSLNSSQLNHQPTAAAWQLVLLAAGFGVGLIGQHTDDFIESECQTWLNQTNPPGGV